MGLVLAIVGAVIALLTNSSGHTANSGVYTAGVALAGIGGVIVFISWILALISSAVLGRWGWFAVTLILGLIGLMLIIMIVYSLVGPTQRRVLRPTIA